MEGLIFGILWYLWVISIVNFMAESFSHDDKLLIFLISVYTRLLSGWLLLRLKETLGIRLVMLYVNCH